MDMQSLFSTRAIEQDPLNSHPLMYLVENTPTPKEKKSSSHSSNK